MFFQEQTAELKMPLPTSISRHFDENRPKVSSTVKCEEKELSKVNEKIFFCITSLGFSQNDNPLRIDFSKKNLILLNVICFPSKCDCVDENIKNGIRKPNLSSFAVVNPLGYKIVENPLIINYDELKISFPK